MTGFPDKLRLKEMAEEDIYFAKRDRELIAAMHERRLAEHLKIEKKKARKKAEVLEVKYASASAKYKDRLKKLGKRYRSLVDKAKGLVGRKRG